MMTRRNQQEILIPLLVAMVMIGTFWWVSRTLSTVVIFIPAVIISYLFYFSTARKNPPVPYRVLPLYLMTLAVQFFHFLEEYLTGFTVRVAELPGQSEMVMETWIIFNMCAYAVFVLGGIALLKKNKEFMIIPIFFVITYTHHLFWCCAQCGWSHTDLALFREFLLMYNLLIINKLWTFC